MTYRGIIKSGVVVFDEPPPLSDGTPVSVEAIGAKRGAPQPKADQPAFRPVGRWDGPPGELDILLSEIQNLRDADVKLESESWE